MEATKTEPDKNTYLVLRGRHGPDAAYDYGSHFVFQGHESGRRDAAGQARSFISRVNLDADAAHRVTVLAATDKAGNALPSIATAGSCIWGASALPPAVGNQDPIRMPIHLRRSVVDDDSIGNKHSS